MNGRMKIGMFLALCLPAAAWAEGPIARNLTNAMPVLSAQYGISLPYTDKDGGAMTFKLLSNPVRGTLEYWAGEAIAPVPVGVPLDTSWWTYTATGTGTGTDSFTWEVSDGTATSGVATVTLELTNNFPITACATTNTTTVGSVRQYVFLSHEDPDGYQPKTAQLVVPPTRGTLESSAASGGMGGHGQVWIPVASNDWVQGTGWNYTPSGVNAGSDHFQWRITDGISTSSVVTMTLVINANSPPTAKNQSVAMAEGCVRYYIYLSYSHPDTQQATTFQLVSPPGRGTLEYWTSTGCVVVASNEWVDAGSWCYTPSGPGMGSDSFTWRMSDGLSTSGTATASITLTANNVPAVKDQCLAILTNAVRKGASLSYSHADSYQPMTFLMTVPPIHGFLEYHNGTNYVPVPTNTPISVGYWYYTLSPPHYAGDDTVQWRISDGVSTSGVATLTYMSTINRVPVAGTLRVTVEPGSNVSFKASCRDPDAAQTLTLQVVRPVDHGTLTVSGATFTYKPLPAFEGTDSFTYRVNDGVDDSNVATGFIQVRDASSRMSNLVVVVVNDLLLPVISNEVYRLRDDLVNEGYSARVRSWNLTGLSNSSNLWACLRSEWDNTNQWLQGAILIGDVPKAQTHAYHPYYSDTRWLYTDLIYWNMLWYQNAHEVTTLNIWVTRMNADDATWGTQDKLIRRALDANHAYRTGRSRLPHTAYVFDCFTPTPPADTMLEVWPAVRSGGGGNHSATHKFMPERTDMNYAACDSFVAGGEVFNETSHGNSDGYMEGSWFGEYSLYRVIAQERAGLIGSCTSGAFGGIVNNHIFTRGGGLVLAVGGTDINYDGDFQINSGGSDHVGFRARLAGGDSWGGACLYSYPFQNYYSGNRIVFFGDFSMGVMESPSNAMPAIWGLTASTLSPTPGQPVTFAAAFVDPDAGVTNSPFVGFRHQIEWFPEGYDYGRASPACVTNDNGGTGWTNFTYVYSMPGIYTLRVEVMDEWQARVWKEMTLTVNSPPVASNDVAAVDAIHTVTIAVLANDHDPDGQAISIQSCTSPGHGTAAINGDSIVYTSTNIWLGLDTFTYTIRDPLGATASATVAVTVAKDVARPILMGAVCLGDSNAVAVTFDEKVQTGIGVNGAENPANYAIDHGATVTAAQRQTDGRRVRLTTSAIVPGTHYTLTVNNVGDLATPANVVAPNSAAGFEYVPMLPGLAYEYYHGSWASGGYLPDFDSLTAVTTGVVSAFSLAPRIRNADFAFRFTGRLDLATNGTYTFYTSSDDGSRLFIDGCLIVNNDGPHGTQERSGTTNLVAGFHDIVATFCQGGGDLALTVSWAGPGIDKQEIPGHMLYHVTHPDSNGDGLPDAWQTAYFGNANQANAAPGADPDHDGFINRNEWLAGTNPTNGTSCLKFDTLVKESQGLGLGFDTVSGLLYNVYWRSNLVGGTDWALFNSFISTGGTAHVAFTNQIPHGFFQLRVNP